MKISPGSLKARKKPHSLTKSTNTASRLHSSTEFSVRWNLSQSQWGTWRMESSLAPGSRGKSHSWGGLISLLLIKGFFYPDFFPYWFHSCSIVKPILFCHFFPDGRWDQTKGPPEPIPYRFKSSIFFLKDQEKLKLVESLQNINLLKIHAWTPQSSIKKMVQTSPFKIIYSQPRWRFRL